MRSRRPWQLRRRFAQLLLFLLLGTVTTIGIAWASAAMVDVQQGANTTADAFIGHEHWSVSRYDRASAAQIRSTRRVGLNWSPQQAAGAPDTPGPGDQVTAWASLGQDNQPEWLELLYAKSVTPTEIHVYENCSPGALCKVTVFTADGAELTAWEGQDPVPRTAQMGTAKIPITLNVKTNHIKIYLESQNVPGWNEVDAVGLIDTAGQTQWARKVSASSTYASASGRGQPAGNPLILLPRWANLDEAGPAMQAGEANFEDRMVDARGWPMLALYSEYDMTIDTTGQQRQSQKALGGLTPLGGGTPAPPQRFTSDRSTAVRTGSGVSAVTTPSAGGPVPMPLRPIWSGLLINVAIYSVTWCLLWLGLTVPRRFVREVSRFRSGCCVQCGYDLGYDFINGCPECGWRRDRVMERAATTPGTSVRELIGTLQAGNGNGHAQ
jgi:hypothetical protein